MKIGTRGVFGDAVGVLAERAGDLAHFLLRRGFGGEQLCINRFVERRGGDGLVSGLELAQGLVLADLDGGERRLGGFGESL